MANEAAQKAEQDIKSQAGVEFTTYEPVAFASQIVAGMNIFLKIKVRDVTMTDTSRQS